MGRVCYLCDKEIEGECFKDYVGVESNDYRLGRRLCRLKEKKFRRSHTECYLENQKKTTTMHGFTCVLVLIFFILYFSKVGWVIL